MTTPFRTLRVRIALWIAVLLLASLALFGAFIYLTLSINLRADIDNSLNLSAAQAAAQLNVDRGQIIITEPLALDETGSQAFGRSGLTLIVVAKDGQVLQAIGPYGASAVPVQNIDLKGSYLTRTAAGSADPIRVFVLPVIDNHHLVGWVESMQSLRGVEETLHRLLISLLLGGGIFSVLAGFMGYMLSTRALAPIDEIALTAQRISTEDLSARLDLPDHGDEVSRLAGTFDSMLARLESGFNRERQFTADASHELRTPLTAMQTILGVVRAKQRTPKEYETALADLAEETDRLQSLTGNLLRLSQDDSHFPAVYEHIDLSILLRDISDSLRPLAESKGLHLTCTFEDNLMMRGDRDDLIRLFLNLIDNAIKYTEAGKINVSAAHHQNGMLQVTILDTGIGISDEHLPHIFDRFYRVDKSRSSPGAGLGLAIASEIVRAHRGTIEVTSKIARGTIVVVQLSEDSTPLQ